MYIRRIKLKNIRIFEHAEIDFSSDGDIRKWTMILGDNGLGKTTILRSIAMGLGDKTSAAALHRELYGEWIRLQAGVGAEASIYLEFTSPGRSRKPPWIRTTFRKARSGYTEIDQKRSSDKFPWDDIFVCGYGAARRAFGTKDYEDYSALDAVYTLFNYDAHLHNTELVIRRLQVADIDVNKLFRKIEKILLLPERAIRVGRAGVSIDGPWGSFVTLNAIGDGYLATLAWLMDILGWAVLYDQPMLRKEITGIVLLDEIDQHLHPKWQRQIVKLLQTQFPKIQFISTTHTPLCAIGMTDLEDKDCQLVLLNPEEDHVQVLDRQGPPRGQRADQVLTSPLFGLTTSGDRETREQIERYSRLHGKKISDDIKKELRHLRRILDKKLGTGETELETEVSRAVMKTLEQLPPTRRYKPEVLKYEVRRQLRELLGRE